jgi:large subunit ribosomal protein L24
MAAAKIKKGDSVVVRSGKDKGRTGTVLQVMPKDGKVLVAGVNVAARHRKPTQANPQGGIDRREAPMHLSKVGIADPKSGKATRVKFATGKDGTKHRVAVKSGEKIDG